MRTRSFAVLLLALPLVAVAVLGGVAFLMVARSIARG